ncbi:MAG: hypothetical protein AB7S48_15630 [Bacteroidales bacterium]
MIDDEVLKEKRNRWLYSEIFRNRYEVIRKGVEGIFKDSTYRVQLKWFTIHGPEHCKALENTLYNLMPIPSESQDDIFSYYFNGCEFVKKEQLTESERFFLIISAWLHDLGMIRQANNGDAELADEQIRDNHHSRSERYIAENYSMFHLSSGEASLLGIMAYYHRKRCSIDECPEKLTISGHEGAIRVRLLAAYLRLADAMHVDFTRAPAQEYAILLTYNIPTANKLHWLKSNFVLGVSADIVAKTITVTFKALTDEVMKKCVRDANCNDFEEDRDDRFKEWDNSPKKENIFKQTLDAIYDEIYLDLQGELDSVKEVLIRGNISCFLNVKKEICQVEIKEQFLNDIKTILHHYPSLNNPSGSSLHQIIVNTLIQICKVAQNESEATKNDRITSFLKDIYENILKPRKSYIGLNNLYDGLEKINKEKIPEERMKEVKRLIKIDIEKKYSDELDSEPSKKLAIEYIKSLVDKYVSDIFDKLVKELVEKQKGDYDDKKLKTFVDGLINEFIEKLKEELVNKYIVGSPYEQLKKLIDDLVKEFVDGHLKEFSNELIVQVVDGQNKFSKEQIEKLINSIRDGLEKKLIDNFIDEQINKLVEKLIKDIKYKLELCKNKPLTELEIFLYHKQRKLKEDANDVRKNAYMFFSNIICHDENSIKENDKYKKDYLIRIRPTFYNLFHLFIPEVEIGSKNNDSENKGENCMTDNEKQKERVEKEFKREQRVNILLFGYSKLVIKTLCGFRDAVIKSIIENLSKESPEKFAWHKIDLEKTASNLFRIFVCEGQPKNRLGWSNKVVYHDGTNYAKKLHEYGFTNIFLIPDATAASLMDVSHPQIIHFVIMGTNSYVQGEKFIHSAGHAMVAKLTYLLKKEIELIDGLSTEKKVKPTLIFSVTTEKQGVRELNGMHPRVEDVEGWAFARFKDDEEIKKRFFFALSSKDRDTIKGFGNDFMIYNPKLDEIPYEYADLVIDENDYKICKPKIKPDSDNKANNTGDDTIPI